MAIPILTVWEVRSSTGSDTNGGGFISGGSGTDYSQQGSANSSGNNQSVTDAVGTGTTSITSASASFTSAISGNVIYFDGAWYVATYSNSTTITTDRNTTTGTGLTLNVGGALQTLTQAITNATQNNVIFCTGSQAVTSTVAVSLSSATPGTGNTYAPFRICGYGSTRGDGTQFALTTSSDIHLFQYSGSANSYLIQNVKFQGTHSSPTGGGIVTTSSISHNLTLDNCRITGFYNAVWADYNSFTTIFPLVLNNCEIDHMANHGVYQGAYVISLNSFYHDITGNALYGRNSSQTYQGLHCDNNTFYNITGVGCFQDSNFSGTVTNNNFVNCGTGWFLQGQSGGTLETAVILNNIFYNCTTGVEISTGTTPAMTGVFKNNAFGSNTHDFENFPNVVENSVTLTADPFTNSSSGDFSLNNTSGGGAACKGAGFQSTLIG